MKIDELESEEEFNMWLLSIGFVNKNGESSEITLTTDISEDLDNDRD